ncbi:MAG: S9 family peptidase, partial [Acidimicrobiia bacterium]
MTEFAWSPDGSRIVFSAVTKLDPDREDKDPIHIRRGSYKSDGSGLLRGKRRHLFIYYIETDEATGLTEGDFSVASPAWSPDGKQIAFVTAMHSDRDIDFESHVFTIGASGGSPKQITDWRGTAFVPIWTPDGKTIVFAGREPATSNRHSRLYRVRATGGQPEEIAPEFDRNVMVGAPGYPGAPPVITEDGESIIFCARDRGVTHAYSVPLEGGLPAKIVGGSERVVAGISLSKSTGKIALLLITPDVPGDIFLTAVDGSNETRLTRVNEELIAEIDLPIPERRSFTAPDGPGGSEIEGWVVLGTSNESDNSSAKPLLLDIHGGPHNAYGPTFPSTYLYRLILASTGWNVLFINPRGSDGYGEEFFTALTGGWGEYDTGDFMSAVDTLVSEGIADPDRLAVTGYSYGGFMTNWLVSHTDRFAAAVTGGCVTNLASQYGASDFGTFLAWEIGGDLYENRERYSALSPISYVEKVSTPVLILHGQADDRCPVSEAEQWFRALRQQRKTVEMVL